MGDPVVIEIQAKTEEKRRIELILCHQFGRAVLDENTSAETVEALRDLYASIQSELSA